MQIFFFALADLFLLIRGLFLHRVRFFSKDFMPKPTLQKDRYGLVSISFYFIRGLVEAIFHSNCISNFSYCFNSKQTQCLVKRA